MPRHLQRGHITYFRWISRRIEIKDICPNSNSVLNMINMIQIQVTQKTKGQCFENILGRYVSICNLRSGNFRLIGSPKILVAYISFLRVLSRHCFISIILRSSPHITSTYEVREVHKELLQWIYGECFKLFQELETKLAPIYLASSFLNLVSQ
jgi:hypothetical protein